MRRDETFQKRYDTKREMKENCTVGETGDGETICASPPPLPFTRIKTLPPFLLSIFVFLSPQDSSFPPLYLSSFSVLLITN
jgi:hypothetical protein